MEKVQIVICCGGPLPPCEHDKREIENLILFKKRLTSKLNNDIITIERNKVGNEYENSTD